MSFPEALASAAAVTASVGALVRASTNRRHAWGVPLLLVGWLGLLAAIAPPALQDRWPMAAAGGLLAAALAWVVAGRLVGSERWLLAAGAAFLTVRVPVPTGDGTAMLLVTLYLVIGFAAMTHMRRERRLAGQHRRSVAISDRGAATRLLDIGAAALPAIATLSLTWSVDRAASAEMLAFFLVPFVLSYALLRTWAAEGVSLRPAGYALFASGLLVAAVGIFQAVTRQVWWNPKVVDANRFRADFRTNSIFWDPNIYGRALVVAILLVTAWLLVTHAGRLRVAVAVGALAVLVVALWNTYSQSSWVALAAALAVTAILTLPPRLRRWAAAAVAVLVLVGAPWAARQLAGADSQGRAEVVRAGIELARERPVLGWGIGSFEHAAEGLARRNDTELGLTASHTTPVTVLAELGLLGGIAYVALLAAAALAVLARWRRTSTPAAAARARGDSSTATGWPGAPIIWATGTLAALVAHSLLYAGFFEDPTLWVALAVVASLPPVGERAVADGR